MDVEISHLVRDYLAFDWRIVIPLGTATRKHFQTSPTFLGHFGNVAAASQACETSRTHVSQFWVEITG